MRKKTLAVLAFAMTAVGCSQEAPQPAPRASVASPAPKSDPQIAQAAEVFMRAILAGEAPKASGLLTAKAAQRYAADRSILPAMGMQVAQLTVGEIRRLNADEAAVQCLVTEAGTEAPQELCCLLKRESAGWRVAGVAATAADDSASVISFEGDATLPVPDARLVDQPAADTVVPRTAAGESPAPLR